MLEKKQVRDGQGRILGFVTSGFEGAFETLVHDHEGAVIGRTSQRFGTTRDQQGRLVSNNTADPGLLISPKR